MRRVTIAVAACLLAAPVWAGEEWLIVKDSSDAWAFNKGSARKDEALGVTVAWVGRYHGTPQKDGATTFSFDLRSYYVDCDKGRVQQRASERFTDKPGAAAPAQLPEPRAWEEAASDWPLKVKTFVCDGKGLEDAVKVPSKIAALVMMQGLAQKAP